MQEANRTPLLKHKNVHRLSYGVHKKDFLFSNTCTLSSYTPHFLVKHFLPYSPKKEPFLHGFLPAPVSGMEYV